MKTSQQLSVEYITKSTEAVLRQNLLLERRKVSQLQAKVTTLMRDALTGLYNRHQLEEWIAQHQSDINPVIVAYVDIDKLKTINDQQGHRVGDQILCQTAEILKNCCRKNDLIFRQGGDEFLIILPDVSADKVPSVMQRITTKLTRASLEMTTLGVSFSFGVASGSSNKINQLIIKADRNMYQHKTEKINRHHNTFSDSRRLHSMPMSCEFMG